jgi:hypothetical protein
MIERILSLYALKGEMIKSEKKKLWHNLENRLQFSVAIGFS